MWERQGEIAVDCYQFVKEQRPLYYHARDFVEEMSKFLSKNKILSKEEHQVFKLYSRSIVTLESDNAKKIEKEWAGVCLLDLDDKFQPVMRKIEMAYQPS